MNAKEKNIFLILVICLLPLFIFTSVAAEEEIIRVTGIRYEDNKTELDLVVGDTENLTAIVFPYNAADRRVSWDNSNPIVADLDADNNSARIFAKAPGETVITASTLDRGFYIECLVKVTKAVSGISIEPREVALVPGETIQLKARVLPDDASEQGIVWESSRPGIASVDETGKVNATAEGEARIIARSAEDDNINSYTSVTVYASAVEEGEVDTPVVEPTPPEEIPSPEDGDNLLLYIAVGFGALITVALILTIVMRSRRPLQSVQQAPVAQPVQQTTRPLLVGLSGTFASQVIEFKNNQATIGRDPSAQAVYPPENTEVSRRHCTLTFDPLLQQFTLIDTSSNGTFWTNGERLQQNQQYQIEPGERFSLSESNETFTIELE